MFERFTEAARQVVVLAQDEARLLRHNYIGTEHLLLGLARENGGVAARILADFGADAQMLATAVVAPLRGVPEDYVGGFATGQSFDTGGGIVPGVWSLSRMPRRMATYHEWPWPGSPLALGWILFGIAFALGLLAGWLIWA